MPTPVNVLGILAIVLAVATAAALANTQEEVVQRTVPGAGVTELSVSNVNGAISGLMAWYRRCSLAARPRIDPTLIIDRHYGW
jgi:hypothetical protein